MIKIIEKDFLDDDFIIKPFASNINVNDKLYFSKNNTYYFGNYKEDRLPEIKNKISKNRKRLIRAIENGVRFIIHGNSINIFNNSFKSKDINLFTAYDKKNVKIRFNKLKLTKRKNKNILIINDLNDGIDSLNFRYKNLICFKEQK